MSLALLAADADKRSSSALLTALAAYWKLNDPANGNRVDSSGKGWTLADRLGNVGSVAGLLGNAASFPVTGGLTKLWNQTGTPVTSGNFSASLWINATSAAGSPGLLVQAHQTVTDTFVGKQELLIFSSKFTFSMDNATITQDTAAVTLNAWNHVVGVYDGTKQYLFVNGTLKASAAVTPDYTQLDAVYLGSSLVSALIDEAGIWNRALSFGGVSVGQVATGEVAALYNNGAGVTWPFTGI